MPAQDLRAKASSSHVSGGCATKWRLLRMPRKRNSKEGGARNCALCASPKHDTLELRIASISRKTCFLNDKTLHRQNEQGIHTTTQNQTNHDNPILPALRNPHENHTFARSRFPCKSKLIPCLRGMCRKMALAEHATEEEKQGGWCAQLRSLRITEARHSGTENRVNITQNVFS